MKISTHTLHKKDAEELHLHRIKGFAGTPYVKVDSSVLGWGESDENSLVLGLRDEEKKLVASCRVEVLSSAQEVREKLDYDGLELSYPVGLLGKAVTQKSYQGMGFNAFLELLFYEKLHENGISEVVCTVLASSPLLPLMKKLGYRLILNEKGWYRFGYRSKVPTYVGILDLKENYERVVSYLEEKLFMKQPFLSYLRESA